MVKKKKAACVWRGPEEDGITQSLLSRFLVCRERFRLLVVEGLRPADDFNHRIEYGNMWHLCEEKQAGKEEWEGPLKDYARELISKYPLAQEQIEKWYNVCKIQFPIYVTYWSKNPDEKSRTPLVQEESFSVPYPLPSGRMVTLRGKWDSVDWIGPKRGGGVYLQENKTKGDIQEDSLKRQLHFDLQTLMYMVALEESDSVDGPLKGIRYNVVRRPLSGGRGSIRQHKPSKSNPRGEDPQQFYNRLSGIIGDDADYHFMRWRVEIGPEDLTRFRREFLNPVLEQLWDWWEFITTGHNGDPFDPGTGRAVHWRHPFGVWNPLNEGRASELDEYLETGSDLGLERTEDLFPELD